MRADNKEEVSSLNKDSFLTRLAATLIVMTVVSFGGFVIENVFVALTLGYIDNRSMVLPFLLGYGIAVVAVYLLFGTPSSPRFFGVKLPIKNMAVKIIYYFVTAFIFVSIGEWAVGAFVERSFDITWWDYSTLPLNLTKFVSVPTSTGFTLGMMVFMQYLYLPVYNMSKKMDKKLLYALALILAILLLADFAYSGLMMYRTNNFFRIWRIDLR